MDMNVYSVQFIPKLKLKFCEALGIASAFAIRELGDRLIRLDQKLDRFEAQLRKIHRHQMVLESNQARQDLISKKSDAAPMVPLEKKKRPSVKQAKPASRVKKKAKAAAPQKAPAIEKPLDNVTPMPKREAAEILPIVLMIQSDTKTQEAVREYFGESAKVLPVDSMAEIPESLEKDRLVGIFFERNLLSNEQARLILQDLQVGLPHTRFVGVSSYLTLALAKAADLEDDFATFLTQPVTSEDLAIIFSEGGDPNFIAGRD
jgi:hypothetical protein